jgi:tetratricopeptide (TPR) repeat protein
MIYGTNKSQILIALDYLKVGNRRDAASSLRKALPECLGNPNKLRSLVKLSFRIGEIDLGLHASRVLWKMDPNNVGHLLEYCEAISSYGQEEFAESLLNNLPIFQQRDPRVLHFCAVLASQFGLFQKAEDYLRKAISDGTAVSQSWFALAMIKKFSADDADLTKMEALKPKFAEQHQMVYARFLYGLGKAWHDAKDYDRAFEYWEQGASIRRRTEPYNPRKSQVFVDKLIRDFSPQALKCLQPPAFMSDRAFFVNGIPRSGTTLVEQILTNHKDVADGGELNLIRASLIPTMDFSFDGALAYQKRSVDSIDPWGDIGADYDQMISQRFPRKGRIIDKTLSQSHFMGLMMHALPGAKVIWMRRSAEDVALSCFRHYFTSAVPWSWSLSDIAHFISLEDRLFEHWSRLFPERILSVNYEDLVADPACWIGRMVRHVGLSEHEDLLDFQSNKRAVKTASAQQVRAPISPIGVGVARPYSRQMQVFHELYSR